MKGCWRQLKVPAAGVFYQAPSGYAWCSDLVAYQVTGENGQIAAYDVTILVKEGSASSKPNEPGTAAL